MTMEKRNYIKPEITVYEVEPSSILNNSPGTEPSCDTARFCIDPEEDELNDVSAQ